MNWNGKGIKTLSRQLCPVPDLTHAVRGIEREKSRMLRDTEPKHLALPHLMIATPQSLNEGNPEH